MGKRKQDAANSENGNMVSKTQKPDQNGKLQAWQKEPPFVRESDEKAEEEPLYVGRCHCKKVKFHLYAEPKQSKYCHCKGCQKTHGAPYQWSAIYSKDQVLFISGHEYIECYNTSTGATDHSLPSKLLCTECHSPLADEGRNMIMIFPTTLEFPEGIPDTFRPDNHIFYGTRVLDMKDGVPKWEGNRGDSRQIPEDEQRAIAHHAHGGGAEVVKARE